MNPTKVRVCAYLINFHERKGDKILVFCDNLYCLKRYASLMKRHYICGSVKQSDRIRLLERFKTTDEVSCLFVSRVGDSAIDLPTASVIIQIACTDGSRRQEAQRMGRILRPKSGRVDTETHNAFFYTLVSPQTEEVYYASKRQSFLVDQGYSFKVLAHAASMADAPGLPLDSRRAQLDQLAEVLAGSETEIGIEHHGAVPADADTYMQPAASSMLAPVRRTEGLAALSGGVGIMYQEFSSGQRRDVARQLADSSM
jgi:DNA excision repair protein ERCC-3